MSQNSHEKKRVSFAGVTDRRVLLNQKEDTRLLGEDDSPSQPATSSTPVATNRHSQEESDNDNNSDESTIVFEYGQKEDVEAALNSIAESADQDVNGDADELDSDNNHDDDDDDEARKGKKRARYQDDNDDSDESIWRGTRKKRRKSPKNEILIDDDEKLHVLPLTNLTGEDKEQFRESMQQALDHLVIVGTHHHGNAMELRELRSQWESSLNDDDKTKKRNPNDGHNEETTPTPGHAHVEDSIIYGVNGSLVGEWQAYDKSAKHDEKWAEFYGDHDAVDTLQFYHKTDTNNTSGQLDYQPLVNGANVRSQTSKTKERTAKDNAASLPTETICRKDVVKHQESLAYRKIVLRCWERAVHACSKTMTVPTKRDPNKTKKIVVVEDQGNGKYAPPVLDLTSTSVSGDTQNAPKDTNNTPRAGVDTLNDDNDDDDDMNKKPAAVDHNDPDMEPAGLHGSSAENDDENCSQQYSSEEAKRRCHELRIALAPPSTAASAERSPPNVPERAASFMGPPLEPFTQKCPSCGISTFDSFEKLRDHYYGTDKTSNANSLDNVGSLHVLHDEETGQEMIFSSGPAQNRHSTRSCRGCCWALIKRKELELIARSLEMEARKQTRALMHQLFQSSILQSMAETTAQGETNESAPEPDQVTVRQDLQWKDVLKSLTNALRVSQSLGATGTSKAPSNQPEIMIAPQLLETLSLREGSIVLNNSLLRVVIDRVLDRYGSIDDLSVGNESKIPEWVTKG